MRFWTQCESKSHILFPSNITTYCVTHMTILMTCGNRKNDTLQCLVLTTFQRRHFVLYPKINEMTVTQWRQIYYHHFNKLNMFAHSNETFWLILTSAKYSHENSQTGLFESEHRIKKWNTIEIKSNGLLYNVFCYFRNMPIE